MMSIFWFTCKLVVSSLSNWVALIDCGYSTYILVSKLESVDFLIFKQELSKDSAHDFSLIV